jgi:hypothetical protein
MSIYSKDIDVCGSLDTPYDLHSMDMPAFCSCVVILSCLRGCKRVELNIPMPY